MVVFMSNESSINEVAYRHDLDSGKFMLEDGHIAAYKDGGHVITCSTYESIKRKIGENRAGFEYFFIPFQEEAHHKLS